MKKEKIKRRIKKLISGLILILSGALFAALVYIKVKFNNVTIEQILYNFLYSEGTSFNAVSQGLVIGFIIIIVFCFIVLLPFYISFPSKNYVNLRIGKKEKRLQVFPLPQRIMLKYSICIFLIVLVLCCHYFGVFSYISYQFNETQLFDNYVAPTEVNMYFNGKKKNLIYIFAESFEGTNLSISNGGAKIDSYMPRLEQLALDNLNFSNGSKLGGAVEVDGLGWTVAGMVAQTSGIPLKVRIYGNDYKELSSFLPGAYSIGEVLESNGYHNYLMLGSDSGFGGRDEYFKQHGNYEIYDYNWALENDRILEDYYIWWGFEDKILFQQAEREISRIADEGEPFNFTILTADTHFPDGYLDRSCKQVFNNHYADSIHCSDSMIYDFITWIQEQDFYKDTVVVVVGDHLTMQTDLYEDIDRDYQRNVYNVFINSDIETDNNKNRLFTTMDMYPTTLAALGMTIEGNKLGLGTNLFSDEKTLLEELGYDYVSKEIGKKSEFYDDNILSDTYKEMMLNIRKKEEDYEKEKS